MGSVGHGGGPEEAGEFAGDRHGGDVGGFAAFAQALVEAVEPALGAQSDLDNVVGLSGAAFCERDAWAWLAQVVPGGLDEQPTRVAGAGLGDRALAAALTGLVERGDQPEPGRQLRGPLEAGEVADLQGEHERGQRVDPAEATQPCDGRPPLALEREPREPLVERGLASDQTVDGSERVEVGELGRGLVEALRSSQRRCVFVQALAS